MLTLLDGVVLLMNNVWPWRLGEHGNGSMMKASGELLQGPTALSVVGAEGWRVLTPPAALMAARSNHRLPADTVSGKGGGWQVTTTCRHHQRCLFAGGAPSHSGCTCTPTCRQWSCSTMACSISLEISCR